MSAHTLNAERPKFQPVPPPVKEMMAEKGLSLLDTLNIYKHIKLLRWNQNRGPQDLLWLHLVTSASTSLLQSPQCPKKSMPAPPPLFQEKEGVVRWKKVGNYYLDRGCLPNMTILDSMDKQPDLVLRTFIHSRWAQETGKVAHSLCLIRLYLCVIRRSWVVLIWSIFRHQDTCLPALS